MFTWSIMQILRTRAWVGNVRSPSAKRPEEAAQVVDQEVRGVLGREMTSAVVTVPADDVRVVAFGEAADRLEIVGEDRHSGRSRGGLARSVARLGVRVVAADRRADRVGEPVRGSVRDDLVGLEPALEELHDPR